MPIDRPSPLGGRGGSGGPPMSRNGYRPHKKGGAGRHVQLPEWLQASEAWATMKPGPRALYVELKRRYNGANNGRIILSHRDAAAALNVHRNTIRTWFEELEKRGFIHMEQAPYLGPSGIGLSALWALDEVPTADRKPGRKTFMSWRQKQKPRTNNRPPRHNDRATDGAKSAQTGKNGTIIVPQ